MFTGIVTDLGEVRALEHRGDLRARIGTAYDMETVDLGASIACDGVCLTVTRFTATTVLFDVMQQTLNTTSLGAWQAGQRVNVERSARYGDEVGRPEQATLRVRPPGW